MTLLTTLVVPVQYFAPTADTTTYTLTWSSGMGIRKLGWSWNWWVRGYNSLDAGGVRLYGDVDGVGALLEMGRVQ